MEIFFVEGKLVAPTAQILLISPFKEIWERDATPEKKVGYAEFAYIEFMTSIKKNNPYRGYHGKVKSTKIRSQVVQLEDWEPDVLVQEAIEVIKEFLTEGSEYYRFYISAKLSLQKMEDFFNTFDMTQVNERTGNPIYKPKDITGALKDTLGAMQTLSAVKKHVDEDSYESVKKKAGKKISVFADTDSIPEEEEY